MIYANVMQKVLLGVAEGCIRVKHTNLLLPIDTPWIRLEGEVFLAGHANATGLYRRGIIKALDDGLLFIGSDLVPSVIVA